MSRQSIIENFKKTIWNFYYQNKRNFLWREQISDYGVVISEVMLQQTQTHRVSKKYEDFITAFPNFLTLAQAPFIEVLKIWKGLGYNRRALNLQKIACIIIEKFDQTLPKDISILESLPGIGKATARSIYTFAFNTPSVFIETNIRTVFLYFFFKDSKEPIHDKLIEELVALTLDENNPRHWYYALMDYGAMLKKSSINLNNQSVHYKKQSAFIGSNRKVRGQILEFLLHNNDSNIGDLSKAFSNETHRLMPILKKLCDEGLVKNSNNKYFL